MEPLAHRLRERARELGLSDAEVGRRAGLSERRYGNYVRGTREPDLATLIRICAAVALTPNDLLVGGDMPGSSERHAWLARLQSIAERLSANDLQLITLQAEAIAAHRDKKA